MAAVNPRRCRASDPRRPELSAAEWARLGLFPEPRLLQTGCSDALLERFAGFTRWVQRGPTGAAELSGEARRKLFASPSLTLIARYPSFQIGRAHV